MVIKIFSIVMIIIGSFLEISYFKIRFEMDGIETWLSIIIGIALTLFLCLAILNRKKKGIKFLILSLIIYSVLATSAGQSFSLSLFQKEETQINIQEQYRQEEITEIQYRIEQINEKYNQIQSGINETTQTLHDRGTYRTALEKAESQQLLLNEERSELQTRLSELRTQAISHEEIEEQKTNIYQFYNRLTLIPETWLQFIFQTILSIFIAIMAPLGITTLQENIKKKKIKEQPKIEKKKKKDWSILVEKWVQINWMGIRTGKSNKILPKKTFLEYTNIHEQKFTEKEYNTIKRIAIKIKSIDENGKIIIREQAAIIRIMQYINKG